MFTSLFTSFKENILWVIAGVGLLYIGLYFALSPIIDDKERIEFKVFTQTGKTIEFQVEVAQTLEERARGLMFREYMAENHGMIFLTEVPQVTRFWMKNTLIPLDIIFIDAKDRIVHIDHNRQPLDETGMGPEVPVMTVLEINGGLAKRLNIQVGDKVQF